VKLTTHLNVVPRLRMYGAIPQLSAVTTLHTFLLKYVGYSVEWELNNDGGMWNKAPVIFFKIARLRYRFKVVAVRKYAMET
jgi:hypothetical protein